MGHGSILLICVLFFIPTLWAIVDVFHRDFDSIRRKAIWAVLVVFFPPLGGIVYLIFGRRQGTKTPQ